ncbi:MAG: M48 family metallopeptidase [Gammaproteobacteria bacterium]|nr:M48 family metallopeptidase [Gammaproteobacteria bacterium]
MSVIAAEIPPYRIRESKRARRARIQVSPMGEVEVVVPRGFNQSLIPGFMNGHRQWLARTLARNQASRPAELDAAVPAGMHLAASGQSYELSYRQGGRSAVRVVDGGLVVTLSSRTNLHELLQRWLSGQARSWLGSKLDELAAWSGLEFGRLSIRGQRSRWGSCSSSGDISLNRALMFLPADMAEYVLIHELCHTRHMNHSRKFWALVAELQPDYRQLDRRLRQGWQHVPRWAVARSGESGTGFLVE